MGWNYYTDTERCIYGQPPKFKALLNKITQEDTTDSDPNNNNNANLLLILVSSINFSWFSFPVSALMVSWTEMILAACNLIYSSQLMLVLFSFSMPR